MKKNFKELLKIGIVVSALVLSLAACGSSQSSGKSESGSAEAAETPAEPAPAETPAETPAEPAPTETPAETPAESPAETAEGTVFENGGFKLTVPTEYVEELIVETPQDDENGILFSVSEKASVEANKALGYDYDGAGWIFSIVKVDEARAHELMCGDMVGGSFAATDADGNYYVVGHPTDVRYMRETEEAMQADSVRWMELVEWGNGAKERFLSENEGLTAFNWGGTEIEWHLAQTVYQDDVNYTISTLEFGPLEPGDVDPKPYFDKLTTGAHYEYDFQGEAPDGEYVVLTFPDEDVRFDFFYGEANVIRMVWFNGEYEQLFRVTFEDGTTNATDVMDEWYHEIAKKN